MKIQTNLVQTALISCCVVASLAHAGQSAASASASLRKARARLDEFRSLTASYDPALAELYSDTATVELTQIDVSGESRTRSFSGEQFKALLRTSVDVAKAAGDRSLYFEPKLTEKDGVVEVQLTRYSEKKCYSAPHYLKLQKDEAGEWLIVEERVQLRRAPGGEFMNLALGFSVRKPKDWIFKTAEQLQSSHMGLELEDKDLEQSLKRGSRAPFVVIMRESESTDSVFPTFQARAHSFPDAQTSEVHLLRSTVAQLEKTFSDFKIIREVQPQEIFGCPGAVVKVNYTIVSEGRSFPVVSELRYVRRHNVLFILGLSGPPATEASDSKIWESVRIHRRPAHKEGK